MKKKVLWIIAPVVICLIIVLAVLLTPTKVANPENVIASYDGNGNVFVEWSEVEKAQYYEIAAGDITYENDDNSFSFSDVEEGYSYEIVVRAVAEKRGKKYYSDWTSCTIDVPIMLGNIGEVTSSIRGSYIFLDWDDVDGATSYEIRIYDDGENFPLSSSFAQITDSLDGEQVEAYIRSVRNVGSYTYYSDWVLKEIEYPQYDYANIFYEDAIDLDLERLKLFAKAKGLTVDIEEKEGIVFADLHCSDPNNSGLANGFARVVGSAIGGLLVGATDSASDTINDDFAEIDSMVNAFVESGGVKEYAEDKKEEIKNAGTAGAIVYGLKALFMDTDIHYVYRYSDINSSATVCEMYMIYVGNENYLTNRYGSYEKAEDGLYHFTTPNGNKISIYTKVARKNNSSYNVSVIGYDI
ncbi:MAG: hypothetical protein PUB13_05340 [Lachnospiraceae bacterium]|nr:hypothetical protein [Lachnospiraceae bacterium]